MANGELNEYLRTKLESLPDIRVLEVEICGDKVKISTIGYIDPRTGRDFDPIFISKKDNKIWIWNPDDDWGKLQRWSYVDGELKYDWTKDSTHPENKTTSQPPDDAECIYRRG